MIYTYEILVIDPLTTIEDLRTILNGAAQDGWELILTDRDRYRGREMMRLFFRRKVKAVRKPRQPRATTKREAILGKPTKERKAS